VAGRSGPGRARQKRRYRRGVYRGVRERGPGRFVAEIKDSVTGRRRWLGTFPTAEAAALAFHVGGAPDSGAEREDQLPGGRLPLRLLGLGRAQPRGARIQVPRGSRSTSRSTGTAKEEYRELERPSSLLRTALPRASLLPALGAGFSLSKQEPLELGDSPCRGTSRRPTR